jgi:hypothetical protein
MISGKLNSTDCSLGGSESCNHYGNVECTSLVNQQICEADPVASCG